MVTVGPRYYFHQFGHVLSESRSIPFQWGCSSGLFLGQLSWTCYSTQIQHLRTAPPGARAPTWAVNLLTLAWRPASSFEFSLVFVTLGLHKFWDSRLLYLVLSLQTMAPNFIPVVFSSTILYNCIVFNLKAMTSHTMTHWSTRDVMLLRADPDPKMWHVVLFTWDTNTSASYPGSLMRYIFLSS